MEPLSLVVVLLLLTPSHQVMENLEDLLVYSIETPRNMQKRAVANSGTEFIEEKLIQHSQALEQLVKMVQSHGDITRSLVENLSKSFQKPKMPDAVEVQRPNRRSFNADSNKASPLATLSEKLPKYGKFLKAIVVREFSNDIEPLVVVEKSHSPGQKFSRGMSAID